MQTIVRSIANFSIHRRPFPDNSRIELYYQCSKSSRPSEIFEQPFLLSVLRSLCIRSDCARSNGPERRPGRNAHELSCLAPMLLLGVSESLRQDMRPLLRLRLRRAVISKSDLK